MLFVQEFKAKVKTEEKRKKKKNGITRKYEISVKYLNFDVGEEVPEWALKARRHPMKES